MKTLVLAAIAALCLAASPAAAISFYKSHGGPDIEPFALPDNFSLDFDVFGQNFSAGQNRLEQSWTGAGVLGFGTVVSRASTLTFTYHGSETGNSNELSFGSVFNNKFSLVGDTSTIKLREVAPFDMEFCTQAEFTGGVAGCVSNDRSVSGAYEGLTLATSPFYHLGKDRVGVVFFFDDGSGDNDLDDMVVSVDVQMNPIPIPATGLLLPVALGGLAWVRRKQKRNVAAA